MRGMERHDERGNAAMMGNLVMAAPAAVRYQTVCSLIKDGSRDYMTYGLQCLGDCMGAWVQIDMIEDISPSCDNVLHLAERFNHLQLSPLHFRDAVLDSVNA